MLVYIRTYIQCLHTTSSSMHTTSTTTSPSCILTHCVKKRCWVSISLCREELVLRRQRWFPNWLKLQQTWRWPSACIRLQVPPSLLVRLLVNTFKFHSRQQLSVSLCCAGDLKSVANAVSGVELNDRLVELLITLFDEDGTYVNTVELLNKDTLGGGGGAAILFLVER